LWCKKVTKGRVAPAMGANARSPVVHGPVSMIGRGLA